jgi:hypothetical protein
VSQTAAAPQAAPPPPAPAPVPATATTPAAAPAPDTSYVDTPALLNRWQLIGMSVAIVFGILSALVQFSSWNADGRAADDTAQLVRVQEIKTSLLRADALATNAFLVGGLENTSQRAAYDDEITSVLEKIAEAADAQPADSTVLAALNKQVDAYTTAIAQARANNRQGFPVGAAYQTQASQQLRVEAVPILNALVRTNTDRAEGAMGGQHPFWLLFLGIAALGALFWLNRELGRAFHRRINKGLAFAAIVVLLVTLVSVAGAWLRAGANASLRDGRFSDAVESATARTAANDAKANESLRLIKRGSGAQNETAWGTDAARVEKNAPSRYLSDWHVYTAQHAQIVKLDDGNNWDGAVALATRSDPKDAFTTFDRNLAGEVTQASKSAIHDLRSGRWVAVTLSALTLLLGVAAAIGVARGIGERRREFS